MLYIQNIYGTQNLNNNFIILMSDNFRKNNIAQSVFEKNYNQLPDSKKEVLIEKYTCAICLELIKYENPYLFYECQKIFHHSCLKIGLKIKKNIDSL